MSTPRQTAGYSGAVRLWSIHPKHLDAKGLVALWREGLLARAVLRGETRGYRHHPQLERFRRRADPVAAIDSYLRDVCREAAARGYRFDESKLAAPAPARSIARQTVSAGQVAHEWRHLLRKLSMRDRARWRVARDAMPTCHPSFRVVTARSSGGSASLRTSHAGGADSPRQASPAAGGSGSWREKVEPAPGLLSTQMRPPCASTMPFTIGSRSPAPWRVPLAPCQSRSNTWAMSSTEIPAPVSVTPNRPRRRPALARRDRRRAG